MIKATDFIHPEDAAALRQLESIPGFATLIKKLMSMGLEQLQYGINMASAIRLSPKQLPQLYSHLPPICKTLGIEEPEFYLSMDPNPNACTFGDTKIYISVTSGLLDLMNGEELDAVIAHECGHILCHHVLYHSMAQYLVNGLNHLGALGNIALPVQYALLYWERKSELSCDRAACIVTSPEVVTNVMARLAGGASEITKDINMQEWATQANRYEELRQDGLWNRTLQMAAIMSQSHPFAAVRVREILLWGAGEQYKMIKNRLSNASSACCPHCGRQVDKDWSFCKYCGTKL